MKTAAIVSSASEQTEIQQKGAKLDVLKFCLPNVVGALSLNLSCPLVVLIQPTLFILDFSGETLSVVDLASNEQRASDDESERYIEEGMILKLKHELAEQNDKFTSLEARIHKDQITYEESAKLRMRLRGTQAKFDSFHIKYERTMEEMEHMDKRYREASEKLKKQLGLYCTEVLNLKKQLATLQGLS